MEKITANHPLSMSENIVQTNIETLKKLFPTIVKEGKIDIKELEALLGNEVETNEEYYRFTWAGKSNARREANKPSTATLRPDKASSKDWDNTQNIFIEGDNLEVLKLLQKSYANQIKMIYIDPPYNTGKDFVYKDNYTDNLSNYLQITRQVDADGKRISTNTESDGRYHSNWLNMMYPRLKLARNLLKEDGVIFISIDDNEVHNLKKLCDEIFGEFNYINTVSIKAKPSAGASGGGEDKRLKKNTEYLLIYVKDREIDALDLEKAYDEIKLTDHIQYMKDENKSWKYTRVLIEFGNREFLNTIKDGDGNDIKIYVHKDFVMKSISEIVNDENISEEEAYKKYFSKVFRDTNAQSSIRGRVMNAVGKDEGLFSIEYVPRSGRNKGQNTTVYYKGANKDQIAWLKDIAIENNNDIIIKVKTGTLWLDFNWNNVSKEGDITFPNGKKPIAFIQRMLELSTTSDNQDLVLDFFAGSGSTGHSVIDLNSKDNGNRKYVLIQLPETTENEPEFSKAGYKTIAQITKERIRRAGEKIKAEQKEDLFTQQGKTLDIGFKAFKLDSSNIRTWDGNPNTLEDNLFNAVNNLKEDRTEQDILFEVLLKYGLNLTVPIEEKTVNNQTIYSVANGVLLVCLGSNITTQIAEAIGAWKEALSPITCRVLFKDNGFANDVEKTNSIQILKRFGITEINSI